MDSSSAQIHHHQDTLESMLQPCPKPQQPEKKPRPADEQALKCPRCDSTNTKFCYYNNYSLSQPRYFCKSCRRYWTKGGTLRNVPVGGGCRRNKRSSTSTSSSATSSSSSSSKRNHDHHHHHQSMATVTLPSYDSSDLTLAIARLQKQGAGQLGFPADEHDFPPIWGNPHHQFSTDLLSTSGMFEALRSNGFLDHQNGFHNLYYGLENGAGSQLEIGGIPYEGVKQEMCNGSSESRALWGFPWQNGIGNDNSEFDHQTKVGWNGMGGSSSGPNWHGLLNSPLMSNIN